MSREPSRVPIDPVTGRPVHRGRDYGITAGERAERYYLQQQAQARGEGVYPRFDQPTLEQRREAEHARRRKQLDAMETEVARPFGSRLGRLYMGPVHKTPKRRGPSTAERERKVDAYFKAIVASMFGKRR